MTKLKKTPAAKKTGKLARNDIKSAKNRIKSTKSSIKSSKNTIKSGVKKTTKISADVQKATIKTADQTVQAAKSTKNRRNPLSIVKQSFVNTFGALGAAIKDHQSRRPHRSFRHTPRKIHQRPLQIEGYFKFSFVVLRQMWRERGFYLKLILLLVFLSIMINGLLSQDSVNIVRDLFNKERPGQELSQQIFKSSLLLIFTATSGGLNPASSEATPVILSLIIILTWLAVIWFLRKALVGEKVKLRDAFYNSAYPLVKLLLILFYILIQLIPMMIFIIFYASAQQTDFATSGVEGLIVHVIGILIISLSIYWIQPSLVTLILITLPDLYPLEALKLAGDITVGRRLKMFFRLFWHLFQVVSAWIVIGIPLILLHEFLVSKISFLEGLPIVSFLALILSVISLLWTFTYCYFLYRRLIEDESQPA